MLDSAWGPGSLVMTAMAPASTEGDQDDGVERKHTRAQRGARGDHERGRDPRNPGAQRGSEPAVLDCRELGRNDREQKGREGREEPDDGKDRREKDQRGKKPDHLPATAGSVMPP